MNSMHRVTMAALLLCACLHPVARAAGSDWGGTAPQGEHPQMAVARQAIDAQDWAAATRALSTVVAAEPDNADAHNYLGYAARKQGRLDEAFRHYDRALAINPKHRGAHEYVGEAWLMAGDLTKAEAHLSALDKLCVLPCDEYRDLKAAIAAYKQRPATPQSAP